MFNFVGPTLPPPGPPPKLSFSSQFRILRRLECSPRKFQFLKEVKGEISDPNQGSSSLLSMGFGEGLSWVQGICQKLETSANEYFEACTEYVNTASKHIKKIYEEVGEWDDPYEIEGEVCDLDLTHETIIKVSNESSVEPVNNSSNEKKENLSTTSIPEDSDTVALSRESQALGPGTACDVDNEPLQTGVISSSNDSGENLKGSSDTFSLPEDSDTVGLSRESRALSHETASYLDDEPLQTGAVSCSNDLGEKCKESSDTFTLLQGPTSSPEQDFAQLLESSHDAGSPTITGHIPSVEAIEISQDKMGSCINQHEQQIGPNKFETPDVAEVSDSMEDLMSCTPKTLVQNAQPKEFEATEVEYCGDGSLTKVTALISHSAVKNISFKKKLKNVFISRRGQKAHNPVNYLHEDDATRMQNKQRSSAFSVPSEDGLNLSSRPDSIESEWELL